MMNGLQKKTAAVFDDRFHGHDVILWRIMDALLSGRLSDAEAAYLRLTELWSMAENPVVRILILSAYLRMLMLLDKKGKLNPDDRHILRNRQADLRACSGQIQIPVINDHVARLL
jgi:hypothetical protein